MKVICVKSCGGKGFNLVAGQEYDLTAAQVKSVGKSVQVLEKPKPKRAK